MSAPATSVACMIFHNVMLFLGAVFAGIPNMWHIAWLCVLCQHAYCPVHWFSCKKQHPLDPHVVAVQLVKYLLLQYERYNYSFAIHCHTFHHARSCLIGQYLPKLGSISFLFWDHLYIMCACSICSSVFSLIAALMSSVDMQTGISTVMPIVCMLMFIPAISRTLVSVWLWWDSQSNI